MTTHTMRAIFSVLPAGDGLENYGSSPSRNNIGFSAILRPKQSVFVAVLVVTGNYQLGPVCCDQETQVPARCSLKPKQLSKALSERRAAACCFSRLSVNLRGRSAGIWSVRTSNGQTVMKAQVTCVWKNPCHPPPPRDDTIL